MSSSIYETRMAVGACIKSVERMDLVKFKSPKEIPTQQKKEIFDRVYEKFTAGIRLRQINEPVKGFEAGVFELLAEELAELNDIDSQTLWKEMNELFE